ncbi:MAG: glucose-6-phosphate isomerase [Litoreibacter sp.]
MERVMNWTALKKRAAQRSKIADLFKEDQDRASNFSIRSGDVLFDYSKTNIAASDLEALIALTESSNLPKRRAEMFSGVKINETEDRAVLHTALRNLGDEPLIVEGEDVLPEVRATRNRMEQFSRSVRDGTFQAQGGAITDVVNIGIGGSDLGPAMAVLSLAPYHDGPRTHFVSNVDGADIHSALQGIDPKTTLVIVASKTFTTIETMTNARTAFDWMANEVKNPAAQFAALSSATDKTSDFGIDPSRVFGFEDWVGGRYSVWGPIGLSLMLAIGADHFAEFLRGAYEMDVHFQTAEMDQNLPVMLALVGIWHNQGCGFASRAVLPYDQRLSRLPAYLQQLEMESNGKAVAMDGSDIPVETGPIVWGEPGTNGQHAFYQLIHQGTHIVPCEFMVAREGHEPDLVHQHQLLVANCLAQSEALMVGRSLEQAVSLMKAKGLSGAELDRQARHRVFPGNRPSTTLIYPKLTPYMLGQIIALYEHRVFVEGVILGLNSFDQWGVELGKELANALTPILNGDASDAEKDGSTRQLIAYLNGRQ